MNTNFHSANEYGNEFPILDFKFENMSNKGELITKTKYRTKVGQKHLRISDGRFFLGLNPSRF